MTFDSDLFFKEMMTALKKKLPFVGYRTPNTRKFLLHAQKNGRSYLLLKKSPPGFVFAPFDSRKKTLLIPFSKARTFVCRINPKKESNDYKCPSYDKADKRRHISLVKKGIEAIEKGAFEKVVLSRKEEIPFKNLNINTTLHHLLNAYPSAFVYIWYHPLTGIWMGATPETLLEVDNGYFYTMSLAATKVYKGTTSVDWSQKERNEQSYVSTFIAEKLALKTQYLQKSPPVTMRAGNLLHLKSDIQGKIISEKKVVSMVKSLHPTPAVCGAPQTEAKDFILQNEGHDREYYTGFLGPLDPTGKTDLYVNLRCMKVAPEKITLYAGGGITCDSIPEDEWEETVAKTHTLKKMFAANI